MKQKQILFVVYIFCDLTGNPKSTKEDIINRKGNTAKSVRFKSRRFTSVIHQVPRSKVVQVKLHNTMHLWLLIFGQT